MIDALVSIIVMATALLALAVLQGALTRNTADARARSQIAQFGEGVIDQLRQAGYSALTNGTTSIAKTAPSSPASCTNTNVTGFSRANALYCAEQAAGVSSLAASQTVATYTYSNPSQQGGTNCSGKFVAGTGGSCADSLTAAYKDVSLTMTWNDATGTPRTLTQHTIVNSLALDSGQGLQNSSNFVGSVTSPIVRQISPVVPGVIPIAMGNNTDTAATNPRPELSTTTNATSYNVLTYKDLITQVQIQQRIETTVVGCSCKYGNQLTSGVFAPAWRPTFWDGTHYIEPQPTISTNDPTPAGVNPNAPSTQSPLCGYCCRDHHDFDNDVANPDPSGSAAITDPVKYDPFRITQGDAAHTHYYWDTNSSKFLPADNAHPYLESCRMIRVNGLWRTATDMNAEQIGMLLTEAQNVDNLPATPASTQPSTSWIPDANAEVAYQDFVKDYLNQKAVGGNASLDAAGIYNTDMASANHSKLLNYTGVDNYLHVRGLYLDHLEDAAQKQITSAISHCASPNTAIDCALPFLPFTSVNLTELALWGAPHPGSGTSYDSTGKSTLIVTNAGTLTGDFSSNPPSRGKVSKGSLGGTQDDILIKMTLSNSGVAAGVPGSSQQSIDPKDAVLAAHYSGDPTPLTGSPNPTPAYTFMQRFNVRAAAGDAFSVNAVGVSSSDLPQVLDSNTNNDPAFAWYKADGSDSGDCTTSYDLTSANPNPYTCNTDLTLTTTTALNLWVKNYNYIKYVTVPNPCDSTQAQVQQGYCEYAKVSGVTTNVLGVPTSILAGSPDTSTNTGKVGEISKLTLTPGVIATNGTVTVQFQRTGETAATFTCDNTTTPVIFNGFDPLPCQ